MFIKTESLDSGDAGIVLNEYNKKIQLVQGYQSDDHDSPIMNFGFPSFNNKAAKTAVPMGVVLGTTKKQAIRNLKKIIKELEG